MHSKFSLKPTFKLIAQYKQYIRTHLYKRIYMQFYSVHPLSLPDIHFNCCVYQVSTKVLKLGDSCRF